MHEASDAKPAFNVWGMASSLAESLKKNTADIAAGIQSTDWRAELEAFGKGAIDEGQTAAKHTPERPVMHHAHVHAALLLLPSRPACLVLHLFLPNCPTTDQQ